ncbi:hypothetical protein CMI42_02040 [Candidatus Pacearchaeota archaeon]|nr:hypothetical protein [Candidatus Pacearchaeota archaeon]|tara:strand:+ start:782 stop:1588 length:807 start_codon:yes stop_codon:yes gene_type:complete
MKILAEEIAQTLEDDLDDIVREIAKDKNVGIFVDNPDLLEDRLKKWHQFGLVTHTKKVRGAFNREIKEFLVKWSVFEEIERELSEEIDGVRKKILLEISVSLHDLGKIVCYGSTAKNRGHEFESTVLLKEDYLKNKLIGYGLSVKQIEYVTRCVETHFSLGQEMRDALKDNGLLNMEYLSDYKSKEGIDKLCERIGEKYADVKIEIGVFFLADCLGKTDVRSALNNLDRESIEGEIKDRGLPEELINAAMQLPLSVMLAERYLRWVCE